MLKFINIGWQSNRAVYFDQTNQKFYISGSRGFSKNIFFLAPVVGTLMGGLISGISLLIGETDTHFRLMILFVCYVLVFMMSIYGKSLLIRKWSLQPYYPTTFQIRELLASGKKQRVGQLILIVLMVCFVLLLSYDYLQSGRVRPLLISTFLVSTTSLLLLDNSPWKRRQFIKQLEEKSY